MDMTIGDMLEMQEKLYKAYGEPFGWMDYTPKNAAMHWLYMLGEAGEVVDALKKKASENIKRRDKEQLKKVHELATIIGEGKMADPSAKSLLDLTSYLGIPPDQARNTPQIKDILDSSLKYTQNKENLCKTLGISVEEAQKDPKLIGKKLRE